MSGGTRRIFLDPLPADRGVEGHAGQGLVPDVRAELAGEQSEVQIEDEKLYPASHREVALVEPRAEGEEGEEPRLDAQVEKRPGGCRACKSADNIAHVETD